MWVRVEDDLCATFPDLPVRARPRRGWAARVAPSARVRAWTGIAASTWRVAAARGSRWRATATKQMSECHTLSQIIKVRLIRESDWGRVTYVIIKISNRHFTWSCKSDVGKKENEASEYLLVFRTLKISGTWNCLISRWATQTFIPTFFTKSKN